MKNKISFIEVIKWILTLLLTIGFAILGSVCHGNELCNPVVCGVILGVLSVGLIAGSLANLILKKRFVDKLDRENLQKELLAKREKAHEIAEKQLIVLEKMIRNIDMCAVIVLICTCAVDFCFFVIVGGEGGGMALPMAMGVYCGLSFIRPHGVKVDEKKNEEFLSETDYPLLYGTAHRAAKKIGCDGKIKICIDHNFNAGILVISDGYAITLGTYLLDNLSQEELYNVLLHEFAHVTEEHAQINRIINYVNLTMENNSLYSFAVHPFIYLHSKFLFEFVSYKFVCSMINEDAADKAMCDHGDPETASSMLVKLKFSELYEWEMGTYDEENLLASEELIGDYVRRQLAQFKSRLEIRKDDWVRMIDSEILARNATHPTVKMRIESLGINEAHLIPKRDNNEYLAEVDRAVMHMEHLIHKANSANYKMIRTQVYEHNLKLVNDWEEQGRPITKENYQNIVVALFELRKITEFVNLCCQIIEELPEPANYFAHHMYGCYLLHSYDERGIDHLYKSIELNHNNWDEALQTIGEYACMVGKQDELDKYRARAEEMLRTQMDVYDKMNSLASRDKIVEEKLPARMLEDLLDYVKSVDEGLIERIYMVRKVISDEHFVTCVIVQPKRKAEPQKYSEMMEKLFQYLDKSSDWQFSLFDIRSLAGVRVRLVRNSCIYNAKTQKKNDKHF